SQVGIAIGMMRAGVPGGVAAWLGFTLPSALAMALFALYFREQSLSGAGWLRGLLIVAVAVVAAAVWEMAVKLTPDRTRASSARAAAIVTLAAFRAGSPPGSALRFRRRWPWRCLPSTFGSRASPALAGCGACSSWR